MPSCGRTFTAWSSTSAVWRLLLSRWRSRHGVIPMPAAFGHCRSSSSPGVDNRLPARRRNGSHSPKVTPGSRPGWRRFTTPSATHRHLGSLIDPARSVQLDMLTAGFEELAASASCSKGPLVCRERISMPARRSGKRPPFLAALEAAVADSPTLAPVADLLLQRTRMRINWSWLSGDGQRGRTCVSLQRCRRRRAPWLRLTRQFAKVLLDEIEAAPNPVVQALPKTNINEKGARHDAVFLERWKRKVLKVKRADVSTQEYAEL